MTTAVPFIVKAKRSHGTVTYNCPTPEWALKKLRDFQTANYENISVTGPDGQAVTEADLVEVVEGPKSSAQLDKRATADFKS